MRKNICVTGFVIIGAAALFVGLAGTARAIPDSISSWTSRNQQNDHDVVSSIGRYDDNQNPAGPVSSVVFGADLKENMGKPHVLGVRTFDRPDGIISSVVFAADLKENMGMAHIIGMRTFDRPDGIISSVVFGADLKENMGMAHIIGVRTFDRDSRVVPGSSPASVPDGGTTAIMMGGALCGLVLLKKKLKV